MMSYLNYNIIGITETHLDSSVSSNDILFRCFHPAIWKNRNIFGGGILFYIFLDLHFVLGDDRNDSKIELI